MINGNPGVEPGSPALQVDSLPTELSGKPVYLFSRVQTFATLWTVAHQAPLSMGFPRQEYCSGLPFPPPGNPPNPGIKPLSLVFPALPGRFFYHQHHLGITMSILRQFFQLLLLKSWLFLHKHSHSFDSFFNQILLCSHLANFHTWCFYYHPVLSILLFYLLYFLFNQVIILSHVLTFKAYGFLRYSLITDF